MNTTLSTETPKQRRERMEERDRMRAKMTRDFIRRAKKAGLIEGHGGGWYRMRGIGLVQGQNRAWKASQRITNPELKDQYRCAFFGWPIN